MIRYLYFDCLVGCGLDCERLASCPINSRLHLEYTAWNFTIKNSVTIKRADLFVIDEILYALKASA